MKGEQRLQENTFQVYSATKDVLINGYVGKVPCWGLKMVELHRCTSCGALFGTDGIAAKDQDARVCQTCIAQSKEPEVDG